MNLLSVVRCCIEVVLSAHKLVLCCMLSSFCAVCSQTCPVLYVVMKLTAYPVLYVVVMKLCCELTDLSCAVCCYHEAVLSAHWLVPCCMLLSWSCAVSSQTCPVLYVVIMKLCCRLTDLSHAVCCCHEAVLSAHRLVPCCMLLSWSCAVSSQTCPVLYVVVMKLFCRLTDLSHAFHQWNYMFNVNLWTDFSVIVLSWSCAVSSQTCPVLYVVVMKLFCRLVIPKQSCRNSLIFYIKSYIFTACGQ